ncbi:MAG: sigma-70 family RNA polymerase sigma factor [Vicinamibacterales bacterium]
MVRSLETLATGAASLQAYLRDIARHPRLSADDERALGRRFRQLADEDALCRLVESNLRFVVGYARRYAHLGVPLLELIHEGNLGLLAAAHRVDPERPGPFIDTAAWWIRQALVERLGEGGRTAAEREQAEARRAEALRADVTRAVAGGADRDPSDLSRGEVDALVARAEAEAPRRRGARPATRALDPGVFAEGAAPALEDPVMRAAFVGELEQALESLDPREREVVRLRYGLSGGEPRTAGEVGERLRVPRGRVRRIETRAVQKLRRQTALKGALN